jgi:Ni2+-binding GTPase involved in maturation of urease and hydrogenase
MASERPVRLIVLAGAVGCGKTTLLSILYEMFGYSRFIVANRQPSEGRSERFNGRLESRFHGVSCSNKAGCTRLPPIFDRSGARAVGSKSRPAARFTLLLTR